MKFTKKTIYGLLLTTLLSSNCFADCTYELFSISSTKDTKVIDFLNQLSDECEFSIIVADENAQKFLEKKLNKTHLKNLTINEVLDIILKENNLSYTLKNNILKISYVTTKIFNIDYILTQRRGIGSTDVTLSSSTTSSDNESSEANSNAESGIKIESSDEVKFWEELDLELQQILNRPEDSYKARAPIINKNAGMVTVSATVKQLKRLEQYLDELQKKVKLQVLIDVQLLTVTLADSKTTGIDWQQLFALQNVNLSGEVFLAQNVSEFENNKITTGLYPSATTGKNSRTVNQLFNISSAGVSLTEVMKFLKTQGDVSSISNPKVLTLNNQPALITAGTEIFYKIKSSTINQAAGGGEASTTENNTINSVFAGVLLSITPEISEDRTITLKINPSLSETTTELTTESERSMPPNLSRRQLSSVVTVKDGNRIILGGLISTKSSFNENKVPLLGDIPLLGYIFKREEKVKTVEELVIIIEPHIVHKEKNTLSLSDLGYEGITDKILNTRKVSASILSDNLIKQNNDNNNSKEGK